MTYLVVKHNIEVAHRLWQLEGDKCQNIHGHSIWVEMRLHGHIDRNGILEGLSFGEVKKQFRTHLDTNFDHHLLLNEKDPWAQQIGWFDEPRGVIEGPHMLPGLIAVPGDPSTENIAKWIAVWAANTFHLKADVHVQETHVNGAGYSAQPRNGDKQ